MIILNADAGPAQVPDTDVCSVTLSHNTNASVFVLLFMGVVGFSTQLAAAAVSALETKIKFLLGIVPPYVEK